jgi:site-specific DNA-methyltransferase (cytosine-N4-specific)
MIERDIIAIDKQLHSIHPYPCKFPSSIVREHLDESGLSVLDPFCGSGTTLLESAMLGNSVAGIDVNPIAVLISRAKLAPITGEYLEILGSLVAQVREWKGQSGSKLNSFHGLDHWFSPGAQLAFGYLRHEIDKFGRESDLWNISAVALSSIVNRFSNQDTETRYARVERTPDPIAIASAFAAKLDTLSKGLQARGTFAEGVTRQIVLGDIRTDNSIPLGSVDRVITSPPYANTMDYYLYHKQRMNVLGFDFKAAQGSEIGSRYEFSSKKAPKQKWDEDYKSALENVHAKLKVGGVAIYVIGDSQIAGELVDGGEMTIRIAREVGFEAKILDSTSMSGKSKLFNHSFQSKNKQEHVVQMIKV